MFSVSTLADVILEVAADVVVPRIADSSVELYALFVLTISALAEVVRLIPAPHVVRHIATCGHPLERALVT